MRNFYKLVKKGRSKNVFTQSVFRVYDSRSKLQSFVGFYKKFFNFWGHKLVVLNLRSFSSLFFSSNLKGTVLVLKGLLSSFILYMLKLSNIQRVFSYVIYEYFRCFCFYSNFVGFSFELGFIRNILNFALRGKKGFFYFKFLNRFFDSSSSNQSIYVCGDFLKGVKNG